MCKKIIIRILLLICLIVLLLSLYFVIKYYYESYSNKKNNEQLMNKVVNMDNANSTNADTASTNIFQIDWNKLKTINTDIIGWITVDGTNINYPILKSTDNSYYLKHTYNKTYSSHGSIFAANSLSDDEIDIYGHNMMDKSMFSPLANYMNKDFFYSHLAIHIYTPTENYIGTVFSAYSYNVAKEENTIQSLNFNERINYYKNKSVYSSGIESVTKIVKLITCSYLRANTNPTQERYFIIASLTPVN